MVLTKLTENLNTHQSLPNEPALNAEELKRLWDDAPNKIKEYINETLTIEIEKLIGNKVDKINGKQLSTKDFTEVLFNKLNGVADNANNYTHPATAGNKHIPTGGSAGQILRWSANGTATWEAEKYKITSGTANPSGGSNGDIYIQYF